MAMVQLGQAGQPGRTVVRPEVEPVELGPKVVLVG